MGITALIAILKWHHRRTIKVRKQSKKKKHSQDKPPRKPKLPAMAKNVPNVINWEDLRKSASTEEAMMCAVLEILAYYTDLTIDGLTEEHLKDIGVPEDEIGRFKFEELEGIKAIKAYAKEFLRSSIQSDSNDLLPKKGEEVIIFSPHPDDDVVTMAATIKMLVDRGCKVTIVYLTSGARAVRDDYKKTKKIYKKLRKKFLKSKGRLPDSDEEKDLRKEAGSRVRKREGTNALQKLVKLEDISRRFLNLPYYDLGLVDFEFMDVKKDIEKVRELLDEIKPKHIFYSAEKDPHGTHGVGTKIIRQALRTTKSFPENVKMWGYRGAWRRWPLYQKLQDLVIVPFGNKYMKLKIKAIRCHGSQEKLMFPGTDLRKLWQRARDRNRLIGRILEQLGYLLGKEKWHAEVFQRISLEEFLGDEIIRPDLLGGQDWSLRISGLEKKILDMIIANASIIQIVGMILHYRGLRKGDLTILAKETRNAVVAKYAEIALAVEKIIQKRKPIRSDFLPMMERKKLAAAIALLYTGWNRAEAARILGISRVTINKWIKKFNLQSPDVEMERIELADGGAMRQRYAHCALVDANSEHGRTERRGGRGGRVPLREVWPDTS